MNTIHTRANLKLAAGKQPTITILAYNGNVLRVGGRQFVIELSSLNIPHQIPLLVDHDASTDGVVGHGAARVERGTLVVSGALAAAAPAAQKIIELARSGVNLQASVGVDFEPDDARAVKAGASVNVNGRKITATKQGLLIVANGALKETSILPLGADGETTVSIAAKRGIQMKRKNKQQAATITTDDDNDEQIDAGGEAGDVNTIQAGDDLDELTRVRAIQSLCRVEEIENGRRVTRHLGHVEREAIEAGWTIRDTALAVSNSSDVNQLRASRPQAMFSMRRQQPALTENVVTAALMLHAGRPDLIEKTYGKANGERVAQQAADLRCHSLIDICAAALRADMVDVPRDREPMIRAAFSTTSLPIALGTYADKSAADAFKETPSVWPVIARRRSVNNFREHKIVRLLLVGNYEEVPPGGEIRHGSLEEGTTTAQLVTKARMLGLSRQDVINDDLAMFSDIAAALGRAAKQTMNEDFALTILGNAGSFFASGNGNFGEGVTVGTNDSRLNAEGLGRALGAMAKQTDDAGRNIDVRARILLVPPEMEYTARALISSADVARFTSSTIDNAPTGNPFSQSLEIVVEPRLSNTSYTGYSTTAFYLFAMPSEGAVNVALLNGKDTPTIETSDQPFNLLGVQYRGFIDYGFSLGEPVAAFKSKGAA